MNYELPKQIYLTVFVLRIGIFFDTLINPSKPIPKRANNSTSSSGNGGPGDDKPPRPRGPNIRTLPKPSCTPRGG